MSWLGTIASGALRLVGSAFSGLISRNSSSLFGTAFGSLFRKWENAHLSGKEQEQNSYNAQQAELQRQFSRDERLEAQEYNSSEAQLARNFNAEQAYLQRQFSHDERLETQDFNASEAQKNRDFQAEMDNSVYQRRVADMQAAGINPAFAIGGVGSGSFGSMASSSAGSGSAASASPASISAGSGSAASGSSQLQGLSDLLQFAALKSEIDKTKAITKETEAAAIEREASAKEKEASVKEKEANVRSTDESTRGRKLENDVYEAWGAVSASASYDRIIAEIDSFIEKANLDRFEYQVLGDLKKELYEAQAKHYNSETVINNWRSSIIHQFGYDPQGSAITGALNIFREFLSRTADRINFRFPPKS